MSRPYEDSSLGTIKKRAFSSRVGEEELVWHRDKTHRYITVVESNGWSIQFENSLPVPLKEGVSYFINADEWHRLGKGNGQLVITIEEI